MNWRSKRASYVIAAAMGTALLLSSCQARNQRSIVRLEDRRDAVDGAVLHYRIGGSGPPLLLLHAFMWSGAAWERFADVLGEQYTLIIPDLPGHGYSTGLPEVWSTRRVASQVFELLDHLQIRQVRAIGCSIGAVTLIHMALQQPERLEAMVVISGPHRLTDEVRQGYRDTPLTEPPEWREWNRKHSPRGDPQIRAMLVLLRQFGDNYEDFITPLDQLARVRTRTLIVTGDRDYAPTLDVAIELHRTLPRSSLWVVPNAGHCPFWGELPGASPEAERAFAPAVLDFFRNQTERGPGGAMSSRTK